MVENSVLSNLVLSGAAHLFIAESKRDKVGKVINKWAFRIWKDRCKLVAKEDSWKARELKE
jgi:hypothetical protein